MPNAPGGFARADFDVNGLVQALLASKRQEFLGQNASFQGLGQGFSEAGGGIARGAELDAGRRLTKQLEEASRKQAQQQFQAELEQRTVGDQQRAMAERAKAREKHFAGEAKAREKAEALAREEKKREAAALATLEGQIAKDEDALADAQDSFDAKPHTIEAIKRRLAVRYQQRAEMLGGTGQSPTGFGQQPGGPAQPAPAAPTAPAAVEDESALQERARALQERRALAAALKAHGGDKAVTRVLKTLGRRAPSALAGLPDGETPMSGTPGMAQAIVKLTDDNPGLSINDVTDLVMDALTDEEFVLGVYSDAPSSFFGKSILGRKGGQPEAMRQFLKVKGMDREFVDAVVRFKRGVPVPPRGSFRTPKLGTRHLPLEARTELLGGEPPPEPGPTSPLDFITQGIPNYNTPIQAGATNLPLGPSPFAPGAANPLDFITEGIPGFNTPISPQHAASPAQGGTVDRIVKDRKILRTADRSTEKERRIREAKIIQMMRDEGRPHGEIKVVAARFQRERRDRKVAKARAAR
jgi:hypothetical protein